MMSLSNTLCHSGLLRALCALCIAASLVIAGAAMAKPLLADGAAAEGDSGIERDAGRAGICGNAGFCWIVSARRDALPARTGRDAGHRLLRADRADAKWTADPPDEPPRRAG